MQSKNQQYKSEPSSLQASGWPWRVLLAINQRLKTIGILTTDGESHFYLTQNSVAMFSVNIIALRPNEIT